MFWPKCTRIDVLVQISGGVCVPWIPRGFGAEGATKTTFLTICNCVAFYTLCRKCRTIHYKRIEDRWIRIEDRWIRIDVHESMIIS